MYVTNSFPFSCQKWCSEVVVIEDLSSIAFSTGWGFKGGLPFLGSGYVFNRATHIQYYQVWFDRHIVVCNLQLKLYVESMHSALVVFQRSRINQLLMLLLATLTTNQMQTIYICKAMWGMFTSLHCLKDLAFESPIEQLSHFVWHSFEIQSRCSSFGSQSVRISKLYLLESDFSHNCIIL